MHANDVKLVRIYTRIKEKSILADVIPSDAGFEVVVEAESGIAIFGTGGRYEIQIVVRDITDFEIVYRKELRGHFSDNLWAKPDLSHAITVPKQKKKKQGHVYEVIVSMTVGISNPNVSFAKSPMFIICKR